MNISEEENKHTLIAAQNHQCEMYNTILEGNWRLGWTSWKKERDAEMSFTTGISWKILEILEKGRERGKWVSQLSYLGSRKSSGSIYTNFFSEHLLIYSISWKGKCHNEAEGGVKIRFYFQTQSQYTSLIWFNRLKTSGKGSTSKQGLVNCCNLTIYLLITIAAL